MTDTTNSPLEGAVLFYSNPEPLDPALHGALGVNPTDKPYAFVAQTHIVPLTVSTAAARTGAESPPVRHRVTFGGGDAACSTPRISSPG